MKSTIKRTYLNNEIIFNNQKISTDDFENIIKKEDNNLHWIYECNFINARITVINNVLHFLDGIWLSGTFTNAIWINGIWKDGYFIESIWNIGVWEKGNFYNSTWINGTWNTGTFLKSLWLNGTWLNGFFTNSIWENGSWINGDFESNSRWCNGHWKNGKFSQSTWENGYWESGFLIDSNIICGRFNNINWLISTSNKTNHAGIYDKNTMFYFQNENIFYSYNDIISNKNNVLFKLKQVMENNNMIFLGSYPLQLSYINKMLEGV